MSNNSDQVIFNLKGGSSWDFFSFSPPPSLWDFLVLSEVWLSIDSISLHYFNLVHTELSSQLYHYRQVDF